MSKDATLASVGCVSDRVTHHFPKNHQEKSNREFLPQRCVTAQKHAPNAPYALRSLSHQEVLG